MIARCLTVFTAPLCASLLSCSTPPANGKPTFAQWQSAPSASARAEIQALDPIWHEPGLNATGSMPLGNGEFGANVWMDAGGDLLVLLSHTDSFSEAERLLKLGRVRVHCDPPFPVDASFVQRLNIETGSLTISAQGVQLEMFVDAGSPSLFLSMTSDVPRTACATLESWRTSEHVLKGEELKSSWLMHDAPASVEVKESADVIVPSDDAVVWYHRNESSYTPFTLAHQGLSDVASSFEDPLILRTFGGRVDGDGWERVNSNTMSTAAPTRRTSMHITASCSQADDLEGWLERLGERAAAAPSFDAARKRTAAWHASRWNESFVFVNPPREKSLLETAHPIRIGYDSNAQNRFDGVISDVRFITDDANVVIANENGSTWKLAPELEAKSDFIIDAWIQPSAPQSTGRIADKITAGGSDGFLFDLQQGKLRAIVGTTTLQSDASPPVGERSHVVLAYAAGEGGKLQLCLNDTLVAESPRAVRASTSVSSAYALQRFVTLAATRGSFPVKFNGSIFTIAPQPINGKEFNDDWRAWGGSYWWQNTRLPYHGMLARGDADTMQSLFGFYSRLLPISKARASSYYNASGAYFPETMTTMGTYANADYGWDRDGKSAGDIDCAWWRWAWNQGPELVALMLDHWDYTQDRKQLEAQTLPMAREVLAYFDSRFARDADGALVISPTQSLETYWTGVVNDLPTVAGLREITSRLCALPADVGSAEDRALWERMRVACPPLPIVANTKTGEVRFAAAAKFNPQRSNCENPELFAIWPFQASGVLRDDLTVGRASYASRIEHFTNGWPQDGQQAARLGLADEAASILIAKSKNTNRAFRFPTFWGPNFDWVPDQCHGGNLMTTMQEMLLQSAGRQIVVCPALPSSWSGHFRLKAAYNTTVTASLRDGKVEWITVDPPERMQDVVLGDGWVRMR